MGPGHRGQPERRRKLSARRQHRAINASFQTEARRIQQGRVFELADDPMVEVICLNSADVMRVVERPLRDSSAWQFPAASVSVVELKLASS